MLPAGLLFLIFFSQIQPILAQKNGNNGIAYTRLDPFGTGAKLVRISLVFTRDPVDPVPIGSAIGYQMAPLIKVIRYGTVPFQSSVNRVDPYHSGSDPKLIRTYPIPCKRRQ